MAKQKARDTATPVDERRQFPRIPLLTEVWVREGDQRVHANTRDLSRGGLCLEDGKNSHDVGDEVRVEIKLPEEERLVEATGRVMWMSPGLVGLMFIGLDENEADRIDQACTRALDELRSFQDEKTPDRSAP